MLTVAYCRVSTDEQAAEGFSLEGQTEKLRAYATLHDLGEVTVISDPGLSGKNTERPGLQQILAMVEAGHVAHVLVWRLDRLSRNLGDLVLLADQFGAAGVGLHSFCERIDLSSATGRMFYNVLGSFAQFYREQLAENVTMGRNQAMAQGRWCNRPPTGYDLMNGELVPNEKAPIVRRIFALRGEGASQTEVSEQTGVNYSTVRAILHNRAYIGEISHLGNWLPGNHEPLVSIEQFRAAHAGRVPGRKRGKDLMSGRVVCGLCGRRMSITTNGQGQSHYRCKHRGEGCRVTARSNRGLLAAAGLGMSLLCDEEVREAIRRHLDGLRRTARQGRRRSPSDASGRLFVLHEQRRKLLQLHYEDKISAEQFGEEQARLTIEIDNLEAEAKAVVTEQLQSDDLADRFEDLAALLDRIDVGRLWDAATEAERRKLLDELLSAITVHPDRLVVQVHGAPALNVAFSEVGLKDSELSGVEGGTGTEHPRGSGLALHGVEVLVRSGGS
ncbi:MAG TPA: recombinase family protein [Aquihabitans sp.]|jgi:site-specific DNA recombinase|nr:recombinase family protein [Aquihabitans sp.]